jgi:hypothetical protein
VPFPPKPWKQYWVDPWIEISLGVYLIIVGIIILVVYGFEIGLSLAITFICITTGFSAVCHGFQRLQRMKQGAEI